MLVWRAQQPGGGSSTAAGALSPEQNWAVRQQLSVLYIRFYGALMAGLMLALYLRVSATQCSCRP